MDRYSSWHPLSKEGLDAVEGMGPAALQIRRAKGVAQYPRGKSAMVWFGYSSTDGIATLKTQFGDILDAPGKSPQGPLEFRYLCGEGARESLKKRAHRFAKRFGSPPILNQ